jgi:hypothetical protein
VRLRGRVEGDSVWCSLPMIRASLWWCGSSAPGAPGPKVEVVAEMTAVAPAASPVTTGRDGYTCSVCATGTNAVPTSMVSAHGAYPVATFIFS